MRHTKIKLCTLLLLGLGLTGLRAQNVLTVIENAGTQTAYALNSLPKLSFPTGNLSIINADGTLKTYALNGIRLINFGGPVNGIGNPGIPISSRLKVYPNPVNDELTLIDATAFKGSFQIDIVDMQGKVIVTKTARLTEGTIQLNLNVSSLPKGLYLCRLSKGSIIETSRFVKN